MERPIPPQNLQSWKNETSQPLAPREGGDAAAGEAGRRVPGRGGRDFGGTPSPPPTFWHGLGPFRPASALLGSRPPSAPRSLPPTLSPSLRPGTAPELQRASLPWLVVRVLSALAHLDNPPPRPAPCPT